MVDFANPYKPGAGHMPPYLAGRESEKKTFARLLSQDVILSNLVLTGLRGVGKTVLLETFKPLAQSNGWMWVGTDLSESASLTEANIATRLLSDLSVITQGITLKNLTGHGIGFNAGPLTEEQPLNFDTLIKMYNSSPGLQEDKLKSVLEFVWNVLSETEIISDIAKKGIVFAYDEAQNLSDHAKKEQFPLSLLLNVFQSIQRKGIRFMLVLTGLPTLFPKLVAARTYAERMFRVVFLNRLSPESVKEAILEPIKLSNCPLKFDEDSLNLIVDVTGGYPYFIQFVCREIFDLWIIQIDKGQAPSVPIDEITRKLDSDFFSGRWARATDRQRDLLGVASKLDYCDDEFTAQDIINLSKTALESPFSGSSVSQMLSILGENGLVFKNRHGKYSFAVPLLGAFIKRQSISGMNGDMM